MWNTPPRYADAVDMYLSIKGNTDRIFVRTARRNSEYVAKVLGNRPITSYSTLDAAKFRDWCFEKGMNINTVKRVFASVRSIINLVMREHGIKGSNAFSGTLCLTEMMHQHANLSQMMCLKSYKRDAEQLMMNQDGLYLLSVTQVCASMRQLGLLEMISISMKRYLMCISNQHQWRRLKTQKV